MYEYLSFCTIDKNRFVQIFQYANTSRLSRYASILGCLSVLSLLTAVRAISKKCSPPFLTSNTNTDTSSPTVEPLQRIKNFFIQ